MDITDFWNHIERVKNSNTSAKDLVAVLNELPAEEILSFKQHFENLYRFAARFDLYYAAFMVIGWCNEVLFADFCAALIARGKQSYELTLKNPDSLADSWRGANLTDDAFSYVPMRVYKEKTGLILPEACYEVSGEYSFEDGTVLQEDSGWDFDNEFENRKRLPKLSGRYYAKGNVSIQRNGCAIFKHVRHSEDLCKKFYQINMVKRSTE